MNHWNIPTAERKISMEEVYQAYKDGLLEEVFGTGTAAVISPVGELFWNNNKLVVSGGNTGELSMKLYNTLTAIQVGNETDPFGWVVEVAQDEK